MIVAVSPPDSSRYDLPAAARIVLWLVIAWYVAYVGNLYVRGYAAARAGERPLYTDFTHTYAGSLLLRNQPAVNLFDGWKLRDSMVEAAVVAYGPMLSNSQSQAVNYSAWKYPPSFLFFVAPLAHFPYLLAFLGWCAATAAVYLAAMRSILPSVRAWPLFALAAPPVLNNLTYGQTGFLIAGLIGAGLTQIGRRPVLAGVLLGLASVKPNLGLLIPFALAAGGHWRVFRFAALTAVSLIVASATVYGPAPWFSMLDAMTNYIDGIQFGALHAMVSVLGAVQLLGGSEKAAWLAQSVSSACAAGLVAWAWWRAQGNPDRTSLACAALCFATPLATPSVHVYDLVLLAPGAAWLWRDYCDRGSQAWENVALAVPMVALIAIYPLAQIFGLPIGPACFTGLLALALLRLVRS
jgi:alpha-1,2-mannosyltransferase